MHSLAWSPLQRLPRKFTSKEMTAPFSLNLRIISMPVMQHCGLRASVIPLVWKHLVEANRESSKSSMEILLMVECFRS